MPVNCDEIASKIRNTKEINTTPICLKSLEYVNPCFLKSKMLNDNKQRRNTEKSIFSPVKLIGERRTIKFQIVKPIDIRFKRLTRKDGKSCRI